MAKTSFQRALEEKLKEAVEKRRENIASGGASDYAQYRESVGFIQGLEESIRICEDIELESQ